jgi:hypothetical protein
MSIFEIVMILCFGAAWPFSIYRSYKSRSVAGKSPVFLAVILAGYLAGIMHKFVYSFDNVIYLYGLNFVLVSIDLAIYARNLKIVAAQK